MDEISVLMKDAQGNCPAGPAVKNLLSNAWDVGSIFGCGTTFPHASEQISPGAITTETLSHSKGPAWCS